MGEIRPIVVKAYVVPGLKHDLLSVKGLNQAGYRVIHDEDEEESGVFAVINKKIDKAKSFPFMSEHSIFFRRRAGRFVQLRKELAHTCPGPGPAGAAAWCQNFGPACVSDGRRRGRGGLGPGLGRLNRQ